jgi:hypothetical protein
VIVNELAQWAVLLLLTVFVVGLTRQLGSILVPPKEQALLDGPAVGKALPASLLGEDGSALLRSMISDRGRGYAVVAVVDENCFGCDALLTILEEDGAPDGAPLAAVTWKSGPAHLERVARQFDVLGQDPGGDRLKAAGIQATPFLMVVDGDLVVRHKQITGDLHLALRRWREQDGTGRSATTPDGGEAGGSGNGRSLARLPLVGRD